MYGGGGALEPEFVKRMSHLPLVNSALRVYEQGKASSRVVKVRREALWRVILLLTLCVSLVRRRNDGIRCEDDIEACH